MNTARSSELDQSIDTNKSRTERKTANLAILPESSSSSTSIPFFRRVNEAPGNHFPKSRVPLRGSSRQDAFPRVALGFLGLKPQARPEQASARRRG